jgi:hypothetical protein
VSARESFAVELINLLKVAPTLPYKHRMASVPLPDCCQVIDSEGVFQEDGLNRFVQQNGVIDARTNYQVVAIMGPQSSGKSTLMNHVVSLDTFRQLLSLYLLQLGAGWDDSLQQACSQTELLAGPLPCCQALPVVPAVWDGVSGDGRHDWQAADHQGCVAGQGTQD